MPSINHVRIARRQVTYPREMKCHNHPYSSMKFLMFGALISWDHFLCLSIWSIFYLLWIMCRNGWKQKPPEQMILELHILSSLTYSLGLEFQELSSVIVALIFVTERWRLC